MEKTTEVKQKDAKEPMTPKQRTIFILKIVGNVIFYGVILLLFLFSLMNINSGGKGGIPNLFGKGYLSVQSTSMSIEQDVINKNAKLPKEYEDYSIKSFNKGDLILVNILDDNGRQKLKVGDVVTFWSNKINAFNTHRIVYLVRNDDGTIRSLATQGDNSVLNKGIVYNLDSEDKQTMYQLQASGDIDEFDSDTISNIKAVMTGVNKGMGSFMDNIHEYWLFIFVIPIAIILVIEVILVIKNVLDLRREKNKAIDLADHEAQMAELQNEKERMRQELLAELRAQCAIQSEPEPQQANEEIKEETPAVAAAEETSEPVATTDDKPEVSETKEETVEETQPEAEEKEEKKEEPVVEEEKVDEPDLSIEENDEEKGSK